MKTSNRLTTLAAVLALAPFAFPAVAEESGEALYGVYCAQCHGMEGNGMGVNIRDMTVQPRDHSNERDMSARSDDLLFKAIKEGGQSINRSVLMPPWGEVFSDDEIHRLVAYMRELCDCQHGN